MKYMRFALVIVVAAGLGMVVGAKFDPLAFVDDHNHEIAARATPEKEKDDHEKHKHTGGEHTNERDDHEGHGEEKKGNADEHNEASEVRLTPAQVKLAAIKSVVVQPGRVNVELEVPGEVGVNEDRVVNVVPRVSGVARAVSGFLGDRVKAGHVLAVIDSRELADAKSAYVSSRERTNLAQIKFNRERRLWKRKIASEQEYLDARSALAEARIGERAAEQKLHALGYTSDQLKKLFDTSNGSFTRYEVTAPFDGTIVKKHVTIGESVDESEPIYKLADLGTIWVIASVYEKDLARVKRGQTAVVTANAYPDRSFEGRVTWVADTLDEKTRTLKIRIEIDNSHGLLKPGMFVRTAIAVDSVEDGLAVPAAAIRRQKGETIVFVDEGGGRFERREVELGTRSRELVQVRKGLKAGERVVTAGSLILKSELEKEGFEAGHAH